MHTACRVVNPSAAFGSGTLVYCIILKMKPHSACGSIFQYNIAVGGKNTDHSGYHETITLFYMNALERFLKDICKSLSWRRLVNDLMDSKYADKNFPFEYYTKKYLMSAPARKVWTVPDLKKLDF